MTTTAVPDDVAAYIDNAPEQRRELLREVFETVRTAMPEGYELSMGFGMPSWVVPLERFPDTYNGHPLAYVSIAGQKNYVSVYLMGLYSAPEEEQAFRDAWEASTGRIDMGKSCLRLKKPADVDRELLAKAVASMPVDRFIEVYERVKK